MTLNNIFDIEKKESIVKRSATASMDEKQSVEKERQAAAASLAGFQMSVVSQIASKEQSQAVYNEVSNTDTAVETVLKIRRLIRSGIAHANAKTGTKLDRNTITVLEGSIRNFDQKIRMPVVK